MKIFYFHVPKTAGSTINKYFSTLYKNSITHIEGIENLTEKSLEKYEFISGHVSYSDMNKKMSLGNYHTIITFREPFSHITSHLAWIRRLAEPENKKQYLEHPCIFQNIASKMLDHDFSCADEIHNFIDWLESIEFYYLHNTQTLYLDINKKIGTAIENLYKINHISLSNNIDNLLTNISENHLKINANLPLVSHENINQNKYGININDLKTRTALLRLIDKDIILVNEANYLCRTGKYS